jgi:hypothetical protein
MWGVTLQHTGQVTKWYHGCHVRMYVHSGISVIFCTYFEDIFMIFLHKIHLCHFFRSYYHRWSTRNFHSAAILFCIIQNTIKKVQLSTSSSNLPTFMVLFQVTLMSVPWQRLLLETKTGSSPEAPQEVIRRRRRDALTGLDASVICKTWWHLCTPKRETQTLQVRPLLPKSRKDSRHTRGPKCNLIYAHNISTIFTGLRAEFQLQPKWSMTVTAPIFTKIALARQFFSEEILYIISWKNYKRFTRSYRGTEGRTDVVSTYGALFFIF